MVFDKDARTPGRGKGSLLNKWETVYPHANEVRPLSYPNTQLTQNRLKT